MRCPTAVPFALLLLSTSSLAQSGPTRVDVMPGTAKPGDPLLVTLLGPLSNPQGAAGETALRFYEIPGGYQAITGRVPTITRLVHPSSNTANWSIRLPGDKRVYGSFREIIGPR